MNFKCPFCPRTFSQRSAYSQHVQICIKKVEMEEENSEAPVDLQEDINDDNTEAMEYQSAQDISFSSMESTHSNILSEISIMSYEEGLIVSKESEKLEESEKSEEESENRKSLKNLVNLKESLMYPSPRLTLIFQMMLIRI